MSRPRKILIIKTGFSEFLDRGISTTVSLGDVLACTPILHLYKNDSVIWVTSWAARQLLEDNPYIRLLLIYGPRAMAAIRKGSFDILINLEKDIGICSFVHEIRARKRYGFYFDCRTHDIATHNRATRYLLSGQENHRDIHKPANEILYEAVEQKWNGQGFILERKVRSRLKYHIGFNYSVGTKWPTKAWPMKKWEELERLLKPRYTISWQRGHRNLNKYLEWLDSCQVVVSADSLGQIAAAALGKKVISLYGPTNHRRMMGLKDLVVVPSELDCPHRPCYLPVCKFNQSCMEQISPEKVAQLCEGFLQ
jgi:heptosyltransferase-2